METFTTLQIMMDQEDLIDPTQDLRDLPSSRKRPVGEDNHSSPEKKFKCGLCDKSFTEHKSLLRHQRESKKHRSPTAATSEFSCDICEKTFARAHDLERHRQEQHFDGKIPCPACGKRIRPKTPHKNALGANCDGVRHDNSSQAAGVSNELHSDLSYPQGVDEGITNAVMEKLTQDVRGITIGQGQLDMTTYKKQVRLKRTNRLLPCGICHTEFEINDACALAEHLKDHFKRFNCGFWCDICEISFVHDTDYKNHLFNAANGDCGFTFIHAAPCTGHHRPPGRSNINDDRFNFASRVRIWELSQLRVFLTSLEPLMEPTQDQFQYARRVLWSADILRSQHWSQSLMRRHAMSAGSRLHYLRADAANGEAHGLKSTKPLTESMFLQNISSDKASNPVSLALSNSQSNTDVDRREVAAVDFLRDLLHEAVKIGDVDLLAFAIACGATVNDKLWDGMSPLHIAAMNGASDIACLLLEAGAFVSEADPHGETPLMAAVRRGYFDVAELLTNHGAIDESIARGQAVIHAAFDTSTLASICRSQSVSEAAGRRKPDPMKDPIWEKLNFLIRAGASVNAVGQYQCTALELAAEVGHDRAIHLLLDSGASLGDDGWEANELCRF